MSDQKTALSELWKLSESTQYSDPKSHSCVKHFTQSFPKKEEPQFTDDNLDLKYNGKLFGKKSK